MNRINYNNEYNKIAIKLSGQEEAETRPKLLLHACCAPCSSTCMEKVRAVFDLTVFYYNPNITNRTEYDKRVSELHRLIDIYNRDGIGYEEAWLNKYGITGDRAKELKDRCGSSEDCLIKVIDGDYEPERFYEIARGHELDPERGARCHACYGLRIAKAASFASEEGYDYFATTLTLSPLKDAQVLNEIGYRIADNSRAMWLPTDFKKEGGYQRSIDLSHSYGLYRQNYCGCEYSRPDEDTQA